MILKYRFFTCLIFLSLNKVPIHFVSLSFQYIVLLTENIIKKESCEKGQLEIRNDIKTLSELMKQGFESMDKHFTAIQAPDGVSASKI